MKKKAPQSQRGYWFLVVYSTVIVGAGLCVGFWFSGWEGLAYRRQTDRTYLAPDYEATREHARCLQDFRLPDGQGNAVSLSDFDSVDVLVVTVWSTDCDDCTEVLSGLSVLDRQLAPNDDMALVTIAVAGGYDDVADFFPQGTKLRILFDRDGAIVTDVFESDGYPVTYILDSSRCVRARFDGDRPWSGNAFLRYAQSFLR